MSKKNPNHSFGPSKEIPQEGPGAAMALKVLILHGKPVFAVEQVATTITSNTGKSKAWIEIQIENGSQIAFVLGPDGWFLRASDPDFSFSETEIMSFFSQPLLNGLWLSHHPMASRREKFFNILKGKKLD